MTMEQTSIEKKYRWAYLLSIITICYNLAEGVLSTSFGAADETLALFGFGVDSFVEVLSGIGIAHMILRMKQHPVHMRDGFEVRALKITGVAFYILTAGLCIGAVMSMVYRSVPQTTVAGIVIAAISILTMYFLYRSKLKVGKELESAPIISDAHCTRTCFYLSFILLGSSLTYEFFRIPFVDALGSLGIAWYAYREGKEAFEKAALKKLGCGDCC